MKPLPLTEGRAVGGPVSKTLLASYFGVALVGWISASIAAVVAAPALAAGRPLETAPVVAVHLVALCTLPFAVAGASFHLLPVMLRNDLASERALWPALALLCGGFLVAAGLGSRIEALVWVGVAAVTCGLAIVLVETTLLVARAPAGRMLIASRAGVATSAGHVVVALCIGGVAFSQDAPFGGLAYERWLLIHLHVALLGWIALLIVTVGRNLAPMLAVAPAAPRRAWPLEEAILVLGLWLLLAGIGAVSKPATVAGAVTAAAALARFGFVLVRTARTRRAGIEAPLAHLLAGGLFLAQAFGLGIAAALGAGGTRLVCAYVIFLLVGWAGGVVVGHVPKLLSLSLWVWWPPGPRPKQQALYGRRLGLVEAAVFAAAVETFALGVAAGSAPAARTGAAALAVSALLTAASALRTWRRRAH